MNISLRFRTLLPLVLCFISAYTFAADPGDKDIPEYNEEEIKERFKSLQCAVIAPKYQNTVKGYIKGYTIRNRERTERIIGKALLYFPFIEEKLKARGLPEELKYLPIVESALNPQAISRAGAVGLWQFMPATAEDNGLTINNYIDERCDPQKSTEAALQYLTKLYNRFDDWALALAAYNGGSSRVKRAIRRSGSRNFWKLRRYLPRETRNYVPAFIAATYLMAHYEAHGLVPTYPSLDLQLSETVQIFDSYSFYQIAQITELPLEIIEALNPAYERGFIPNNTAGNYLTLPRRVMPAFRDYISTNQPDYRTRRRLAATKVYISMPSEASNKEYLQTIYIVQQNETLPTIAALLKCTVHQLKAWNDLHNDEVRAGQELIIYQPKVIKRFKASQTLATLPRIQRLKMKALPSDHLDPYLRQLTIRRALGHEYYYVKQKERLSDLVRRQPEFKLKSIMVLNQMKSNYLLRPGDNIKLR